MRDAKSGPPPRLVFTLLLTTAVAMVGVFLVRWLVPADWLHANNEVAGNYLQTLGTIYAVLLAFVVFVVWQQHNEVRGAIQSEANELGDLHRLMRVFPHETAATVSASLMAYARAVIDDEWTAMAQGQTSLQAEEALEQIWQALVRMQPEGRREEMLYREALARFNDLGDARSHRVHCSRLRLPPSLWALLLTNGGLVIASMWLFGLESFLAHALMTLALAGSIAFILYLIADLDNPFWGAWQVTAEPFRRTLPEGEVRDQGAVLSAAGRGFRNSSKKA